jgi:PAS domain S-box-containing protein
MTRILIVDDKEENLYYLRVVLTGRGFTVETACHGAEALVKARQNPPDVVISDLLMPVMDGFTLLRHWKADARLKKIPFIVYTATYTEEEDEQLALSLGADAFILKPAEPEDFLARIQEVQSNAAASGCTSPKSPIGDEKELLKVYSETLIRKLEEKTLQLEEANRTLQRDIAERRTVETALRESEARLATATAAGQIGIWEWDLVTGTILWSRKHEELWGLPPGAFGHTYEDFRKGVHPDDRAALETAMQQAIARHEEYQHEHRVVWPDGSVRWIVGRGKALYDEQGKPVRMSGVVVDVTERKRIDVRFRRLVDSNAQGVMFWNTKGEITGANDAFLRIIGWTRELLETGRLTWEAITPPEYAHLDRQALGEIVVTGVCTPFEKEYLRHDGSRVSVLVAAATFEDTPEEGFCFVLDITERKKLEQQFLRAQRMESIGTLAGGIAHDLNNVLGPIILSLDLLRMKFTDPASRELLSMISSSAQRGAAMVGQVLSFARGVEGRRVDLQIKHVLREIEKIVNDTFLKNIQVYTLIPNDLWTVQGDPTQLHQVLLNLCVNARDAMAGGGKLTLTAENVTIDAHYAGLNTEARPGPYVLLRVEDSGVGIPPEIIEKIFDPFFTTKEIGNGTGLGLSTTLAIVKSHGGFMRVRSEVGVGTKFMVYLPAQAEVSSDAAAPVEAEMPRGHGEVVLVVDDEPSVRQITKQTLEAFGYRVVLAGDGVEAVSAFARQGLQIAVVLTDMMMPVMDGPATIQVLRRMNPKLPIIAASGLPANSSATQVASLGVRHFLPKPYTAEALLKALHQVLRGEPPGG